MQVKLVGRSVAALAVIAGAAGFAQSGVSAQETCPQQVAVTQLSTLSGDCAGTVVTFADGVEMTIPSAGQVVVGSGSSISVDGANGDHVVGNFVGQGAVAERVAPSAPAEAWGTPQARAAYAGFAADRAKQAAAQSVASSSADGSLVAAATWNKCQDSVWSDANIGPAANMPWYLKGSSTSVYLAPIKRGGDYLTGNISNPCGFDPTKIGRHAVYSGTTTRAVGINLSTGGCGTNDNYNVVAFGLTKSGYLGWSCRWYGTFNPSTVIQGDIAFSSSTSWAVNAGGLNVNCSSGQRRLDDVAAHEFGHLFGLAHINTNFAGVMRDPNSVYCAPSGISDGDYSGMVAKY